jgi:hypothetical protein
VAMLVVGSLTFSVSQQTCIFGGLQNTPGHWPHTHQRRVQLQFFPSLFCSVGVRSAIVLNCGALRKCFTATTCQAQTWTWMFCNILQSLFPCLLRYCNHLTVLAVLWQVFPCASRPSSTWTICGKWTHWACMFKIYRCYLYRG